ncbi:MAG TPA: hypothetical protein V6D22_11095 [Candidatus Obscuribacterales bacterium]
MTSRGSQLNAKALAKNRKRFLKIFPRGFYDPQYLEWEHNYKWDAHKLWTNLLGKDEYKKLLQMGDYAGIANKALQVESRCTFLFSFEKMALRDALHSGSGARTFAEGLFNLLHGRDDLRTRFIEWIVAVSELPRKQSRVLSWPIVTFFPYIAQPKQHMIMKPRAMMFAAEALGFDLQYSSKPSWTTYERLLLLGKLTREAIADLKPRNNHDVQTFLWVIGSAEYVRLAEELGVE